MGNRQSNTVDIKNIINTLGVPIKKNIKLVSSDYKTVVPLANNADEILANIAVKDEGYKDVILNLESTTICGKKNNDVWEFTNYIPAFKIENCYITVYSYKDGEISVNYSVYPMTPDLSRRYSNSTIQSDDMIFSETTI